MLRVLLLQSQSTLFLPNWLGRTSESINHRSTAAIYQQHQRRKLACRREPQLGTRNWSSSVLPLLPSPAFSMVLQDVVGRIAQLAVVAGSWSDRRGRKPILLIGFYSDIILYVGYLLTIGMPIIPLWINYVAYSISGNYIF